MLKKWNLIHLCRVLSFDHAVPVSVSVCECVQHCNITVLLPSTQTPPQRTFRSILERENQWSGLWGNSLKQIVHRWILVWAWYWERDKCRHCLSGTDKLWLSAMVERLLFCLNIEVLTLKKCLLAHMLS